VFSANAELDVKYLFVPLHNAQRLMGLEGQISSLEVFLKDEMEMEQFADDWNVKLANDSLKMNTRNQKNELIYKTTQSEKWATFAILSFILFIASFNIISSLSMLILEKSNDLRVLSSMGGSARLTEQIFIFQGVLINALGAFAGILLGLLICWGQKTFGWIAMEGAVVEYYPVEVDPKAMVLIGATVLLTGTVFCVIMVKWLMSRTRKPMAQSN
jgi:lipoprotein-releasing system permease protein